MPGIIWKKSKANRLCRRNSHLEIVYAALIVVNEVSEERMAEIIIKRFVHSLKDTLGLINAHCCCCC